MFFRPLRSLPYTMARTVSARHALQPDSCRQEQGPPAGKPFSRKPRFWMLSFGLPPLLLLLLLPVLFRLYRTSAPYTLTDLDSADLPARRQPAALSAGKPVPV